MGEVELEVCLAVDKSLKPSSVFTYRSSPALYCCHPHGLLHQTAMKQVYQT